MFPGLLLKKQKRHSVSLLKKLDYLTHSPCMERKKKRLLNVSSTTYFVPPSPLHSNTLWIFPLDAS